MKIYKGYVIINPYVEEDAKFFAQYPKGDDMRLLLMCAAPHEGSFFFFPEDYQINSAVERMRGHPIFCYSPCFNSIDDAQIAIDEWLPIDLRSGRCRSPVWP